MTGRIEKALSGFYYVYAEDEQTYACKPRGIFRKEDMTPLVGDLVEMNITDEKDMEGVIEKILPRKNALHRPPVANIDQALLVFSIREPNPHLALLDRFLVMMESFGIDSVICFNKSDLDRKAEGTKLAHCYSNIPYPCITLSTKTGEGMDSLRTLIQGKVQTVAGPSGAGKSSLINALLGDVRMETGAISKKIRRGKQTTRHTELLRIEKDTYIVDTPGFGSLFLPDLEKEELAGCFPEFRAYLGKCRFSGCSHLHEPDCAIREHLTQFSESRYTNYRDMYQELLKKQAY